MGELESYRYKKQEAEDMLVFECESDSDEELIDSEDSRDCEEDINFVAYLCMHIYKFHDFPHTTRTA